MTPSSFIGELFRLLGRYLPPPAGVRSPAPWGTEERLRDLFGNRLDAIVFEHRNFVFRYRSAAHWLDVFRTAYGPLQKAFDAMDSKARESLAAELIALAERFNVPPMGRWWRRANTPRS